MSAPAYQEFTAEQVPVERRGGGAELKVIAGETSEGTVGAVKQPLTEPVYLDVTVPAHQEFIEQLPPGHNAFVYVIEGQVDMTQADHEVQTIVAGSLALLAQGEVVRVTSVAQGARFLLIAGKPLHEPVARGGPFVMNTKAEIMQAQRDYVEGRLG